MNLKPGFLMKHPLWRKHNIVEEVCESELSVAQSCLTLWPCGLQPTTLLCPWDSPGQNTRVGCHALLHGIFPTQGSNLDLLHCRDSLPSESPGKSTQFSGNSVVIRTKSYWFQLDHYYSQAVHTWASLSFEVCFFAFQLRSLTPFLLILEIFQGSNEMK